MQPLQSGVISIPEPPKTWTWNQSPILGPKITPKSENGAQSDSQGTPKIILNPLKIYTWTSKCPLGDPLNPWITKMVSQVPKMEPQGHHNVGFEHKK